MDALLGRRPRCHSRDTDTQCTTCGKKPAWMALAAEWEKLASSEDVNVTPWNFPLAFSLDWRQNTPSSSGQASPVPSDDVDSPGCQSSPTKTARLSPPPNTRPPTSRPAVRTEDGKLKFPVDVSRWKSAPNGAPLEGAVDEEEPVNGTRESPTALTDGGFTILIPKGFTHHVPSAMNGGPEDGIPGVTSIVMPRKVGWSRRLFGKR